jgi:manganese transport protein
MSTHGHRFVKDLIYGTTVDRVRHVVKIPVLLLRAP